MLTAGGFPVDYSTGGLASCGPCSLRDFQASSSGFPAAVMLACTLVLFPYTTVGYVAGSAMVL